MSGKETQNKSEGGPPVHEASPVEAEPNSGTVFKVFRETSAATSGSAKLTAATAAPAAPAAAATPAVDEDPLVIDEADESKSDSDEKEFEPTLEMMMNDFDDERTLEEEEALESQEALESNEAAEEEVQNLEKEQDMPIEELLKLYGYGAPPPPEAASKEDPETSSKPSEPRGAASNPKAIVEKRGVPSSATSSEEDEGDDEDSGGGGGATVEAVGVPEDAKDGDDDDDAKLQQDGTTSLNSPSSPPPPPPSKKARSELARFYEAAVEGRALRSSAGGGQPGEDGEEDESEGGEDSDDGREYSWKKTIMIGPSYQASVPGGLSVYGDTLPYENEDKLLWNPVPLPEGQTENYLATSQEHLHTGGLGKLPLGAHVRDDEQALFLLLQCGHNCEEALRRRRMNAVPPADTMSLWSEDECRAFELGLRLYGKDFHMIQQQKVRTRSVGELIQFYYLWKKTERHDVFANATRLEKKKYALHPGTTDYMDRFIDEQTDSTVDRSVSPNYLSLHNDSKSRFLSAGTGNRHNGGGDVANGEDPSVNLSASSLANAQSLSPNNGVSGSAARSGLSGTANAPAEQGGLLVADGSKDQLHLQHSELLRLQEPQQQHQEQPLPH